MPAKWLSNSNDLPRRVADVLENVLRSLSEPAVLLRLRRLLVALFAVWGVLALAQLIWSLLPYQEAAIPAGAKVINPANVSTASTGAAPVDIQRLQSWHLFGEASEADAETLVLEVEPVGAANARDGIEKGAKETRLALKLRGVVASSEDGLGYAVIEYQSEQEIYSVEDKLPLQGRVVLAKVMPRQVVLDNGGTYELLELFEESALDGQLPQPEQEARAAPSQAKRVITPRSDRRASELAATYRERLYDNPQALADVVTISAVRENGELLGYRIAPGKDQAQFEQLGFMPGDLVTSVNGIELNDPANTLLLYQTMRAANEAVFELQRDSQAMTVSVSLGELMQAQP